MPKQLISILAIAVLILLVGGVMPAREDTQIQMTQHQYANVTVASTTLRAFVADTDETRIRGLSGREALGADEGMLFVFPEAAPHGFWMKDMRFPIDIVWIGSDRTVVDIHKVVLPDSYPTLFSPKVPAQFVLEANAGWADEHKIKIGDAVDIQ